MKPTQLSWVREYVLAKMRELALKPRAIEGQQGGVKLVNLYGELEGTQPAKPPILLVAHYDSTPNRRRRLDPAGRQLPFRMARILRNRGAAVFRRPKAGRPRKLAFPSLADGGACPLAAGAHDSNAPSGNHDWNRADLHGVGRPRGLPDATPSSVPADDAVLGLAMTRILA